VAGHWPVGKDPATVPIEPSLRSTLPGTYYTSPAMFEVESEQIFARSWICVGRADSVARPGQLVTVQVADESILVTRDRAGQLLRVRQ
jgi:glycine betaine catabolism A